LSRQRALDAGAPGTASTRVAVDVSRYCALGSAASPKGSADGIGSQMAD